MNTGVLRRWGLSAKWLRLVRHDWKCVGVDNGLVSAPQRTAEDVLWNREPSWRRAREKFRSSNAERADSQEGDQGRLVPLRDELLSALPASGTHGPSRGYRHLHNWLPVYRSARDQLGRGAGIEVEIDIGSRERGAHAVGS